MAHITESQRYTICVMKQQGYNQSSISETIGKDKSVISRELRRNSDKRSGKYDHDLAQRKYAKRIKGKHKKIRFTNEVKTFVESHLRNDLSPEQIVGIAKNANQPCVSHERIYQHIWQDKKEDGKLYEHLRCTGKRYRKRGSKKDKRGIITGRVDISQRPAIVEKKKRIGDLEIDTIIGKNHRGAIVTINDRKTGMLKMKKVLHKEAGEVAKVTTDLLTQWKPILHTITADNGEEFANHAQIAEALNIQFFFAKPYHSWERGANKNLNGLIRQEV